MKAVYRVLAASSAAEVVQCRPRPSRSARYGPGQWVDGRRHDYTKAVAGDRTSAAGGVGQFAIHELTARWSSPWWRSLLLVVSFFAKIEGGVKWAGIVVPLVLVQGVLGVSSRSACRRSACCTASTRSCCSGSAVMARQNAKRSERPPRRTRRRRATTGPEYPRPPRSTV